MWSSCAATKQALLSPHLTLSANSLLLYKLVRMCSFSAKMNVGPDDDLRLQFEAISSFDEEEKRVFRSLLEGMILKHEVRRLQNGTNGERK